jgi:hypothetical protein
MNRSGWIAALVACALLCVPIGAATRPKLIVVTRPTVVAFFPPVTDAYLSKFPDMNETLSDFENYSSEVAPMLTQAGIDFEQLSATSFAIQNGAKIKTFRPHKSGTFGYYFIAPGKSPRVEYGVTTTVDILSVASEYFQLSLK